MRRLVFVYNADSGYFNAAADALHKLLSPSTYSCNLCAITYGAFAMKDDWRRFIDSLDTPVSFLHRDEYLEEDPESNFEFPTILLVDGSTAPAVLLDKKTIDGLHTVDELKRLVADALSDSVANQPTL